MATRCCCPAREALGPAEGVFVHVQAFKRGNGHGPVLGTETLDEAGNQADAVQTPHKDVGHHVEPSHQVELLEYHGAAGPPFAQGRPLEGGDAFALEGYFSLAGVDQPVYHPEQSGFSRTGPPDDTHHLTGGYLEIHAIHGQAFAVLFGYSSQFQHGASSFVQKTNGTFAQKS